MELTIASGTGSSADAARGAENLARQFKAILQ